MNYDAITGFPFFLLLDEGHTYFLELGHPRTEEIYHGIIRNYIEFIENEQRRARE